LVDDKSLELILNALVITTQYVIDQYENPESRVRAASVFSNALVMAAAASSAKATETAQ
jgi:hypothetical protein